MMRLHEPPTVIAVRPGMDDYGWLKFFETVRLTCAHCLLEVERTFALSAGFSPPLPRHCSPKCAKRAFAVRSRGRYGRISPSVREAVYERDGRKCRFCGSVRNLTMDHIVPKSLGGGNTLSNLQVLCGPCNVEKGNTARRSG